MAERRCCPMKWLSVLLSILLTFCLFGYAGVREDFLTEPLTVETL